MFGIDRIRSALLIQSALGKHRDRESAPTGKEVSDDRRLLILKILLILEILIQTTESVGGHISLLTTAGGAVSNRAYLVHRDWEVSPTGDLRARLQSAPTGNLP